MTNPRVQIDIVGNDQTGRATGPAEKRLKHLGGEANKLDGRFKQMGNRTSGLGTMVGTFGKVEAAASSAFGSKSVLGNITSRLSGVRKLGSVIDSSMSRASASTLRTSAALGEIEVAGEGAAAQLGETAVAGGLAEGAIVGVGVAAGVAAGTLLAAAAASFKLSDGWSKGAAQIGRTADIIGVASDKLQQFQGAAERVGVDKNTSGAAIGGLSQALNDARYGRNVPVQEVLARLNIPMQLNKDGDVDVGAMLPGISRGLTKLTSSGRRKAASFLGIPEAALPAFTQGDKALTSDMTDYGNNGAMRSASDIALGKKLARRSVLISQWGEKKVNDAQRANAALNDKAEDFAIGASAHGSAMISAAGRKIETGGRSIERAAERLAAAATLGGAPMAAGRLSARQVGMKARQGMRVRDKLIRLGLSEDDATAMAANAAMESSGNYRAREKGGNGSGLFQITDKARRAMFRRVEGVDVDHATEDQQLHYQFWELGHTEKRTWERAHARGNDAASVAAGYARYVERPGNPGRDSQERAAVAAAMTPLKVTVELVNAPPGTRATARMGSGSNPALSHAHQH